MKYYTIGPEWPSRLVARSSRRRPGFTSRSVGLSEINFSDLYCGWLGRNINVEYNTIQHNTTGARWCRAEVLNLFWLTTHLYLQINLATHYAIIICEYR